jgi:probable F420-dependent oxidoreductase
VRLGISEAATRTGHRDGTWIIQAGAVIEALGFDSFWMPERVMSIAMGDDPHPYGADREVNALRRDGFFDPIASLGAVAAVTSRVRIGTYVDLGALRHPLVTAQQIATLDQLSGGRMQYGVGAGWYEDEYLALGVGFRDRGARLTEYLKAIKAVWTSAAADFHGEYLDFSAVVAGPKPVQRPHPPILVGGNSVATIKRIVAVGDGWLGHGMKPPAVQEFSRRLADALAAAGRSPAEVSLTVGYRLPGVGVDMTHDEIDRDAWYGARDFIEACRLQDIDEVVLTTRLPPDGYSDNMHELAGVIGVTPRG